MTPVVHRTLPTLRRFIGGFRGARMLFPRRVDEAIASPPLRRGDRGDLLLPNQSKSP
ncbi:hypothetical protein GEOBRER4_n3541 [Citrifermentans bremense]|uniref:Uncharacterized protein n=1 Tax=Citrifermentans bremense TaxID=60035 RepID=A0A7R7FTV4_9BACT|nr:hypothetical protein GEOBRER4_n3541 [Citrifermentans bremense]